MFFVSLEIFSCLMEKENVKGGPQNPECTQDILMEWPPEIITGAQN